MPIISKGSERQTTETSPNPRFQPSSAHNNSTSSAPLTTTREQRMMKQMSQDIQALRLENTRLSAENTMLRELVNTHKAHSNRMTMLMTQLIQNPTPQQVPTSSSQLPPPAYHPNNQ